MSVCVAAYLSDAAVRAMRQAIEEAHGNEVFFMGTTEGSAQVVSVVPLARGNLHQVAAPFDRVQAGMVIIHNHPSGDVTPSDQDIELSTICASRAIGMYIVDNDVESVYVVLEPYEKRVIPVDATALDDFFCPGGTIHRNLPTYEFRTEQLEMAHCVRKACNEKAWALIEAGTGIGKSFAYLVPALLYALQNNERVVVSTNTINLQEQLRAKDIPFLTNALGKDIHATLVKGRGNYICKRKCDSEQEYMTLFMDAHEQDALRELASWARQSRDGSLSDLSITPDMNLWEKVCSESDRCLRSQCGYFAECFFYKARKEAAHAHILVANHHVLLADLSLRAEGVREDACVMPPFSVLIIDEAHHLEDAATSYFSEQLNRYSLLKTMKRMYAHPRRKKETGLIPYMQHMLSSSYIETLCKQVKEEVVRASVTITEVFDSYREFLSLFFQDKKEEPCLTITQDIVHSLEYKDHVLDALRTLNRALGEVQDLMQSVIKALPQEECENRIKERIQLDASSIVAQLSTARMIIALFLAEEDEERVRWIECREQKEKEITLHCAPIEVKDILKKIMFLSLKTIVATSATLSVDKSFAYCTSRWGLYEAQKEAGCEVHELLLPSSFQYQRQVYLGIFNHLPPPTDRSYVEHLKALVTKIMLHTGGKAFILCTSYAVVRALSDTLRVPLACAGINLYVQGEMNRHLLLDHFKKDITSVLIGTDSFWEGVDVEGESLSHVLITRLPFQVPNDPVIEARSARIEARGGNAFMDYVLPQAIIKFKQGFGRLIRNRTDFGSVLICDSRVISKQYGSRFLSSLPRCTHAIGGEDKVLHGLDAFLATHQRPEA